MSKDLEIIRKIEQSIGRELEQSEEVDFEGEDNSYVVDDLGNVVGLGLYSSGFNELELLIELKNLNELDLNSNCIQDASILANLKKIHKLDLGYNEITDYSFLEHLSSLTSLDLSYNEITDCSFLEHLSSLTSLNLSYNEITDCSFLEHLSSLTSLDLSSSRITDCSFLGHLTSLTSLNLSSSRITDCSFLEHLTSLAFLDLSSNRITDYTFLEHLTSLISLDLSYNEITDCSFLEHLTSLTSLNLSYNEITDYSFLEHLSSLTFLNLSYNEITDCSFLEHLSSLTSLNLRNNEITDYSFLEHLTSLTFLDLSSSRIRDCSFLEYLSSLTSLDLSSNEITDYSFLEHLTSLTSLDLSSSRIRDCSFLGHLTSLASLNLSGNQIAGCSFLEHLTSLTSLNLSSNQITDCSFLEHLTSLTSLNLSGNRIRDCSFLEHLSSLTFLDLSYNIIEVLQNEIISLKGLKELNLNGNKLTILPPEILQMGMDIKWTSYEEGINLEDNPLEQPPIEIVQQGTEAVRAYFESLQGQQQALNEVKVLLVGEGASGKTSLVKRILGENFDPNEPITHGIKIRDWHVRESGEPMKVRMWDFGGQEIMHATHQFFLSKRSLYILVLDGRKEEKIEYWLKHIESFGGNSPVLVVINKIDENPGFDVNRSFLQDKYKGIQGFYRVSCATETGIQELVEALTEALQHVEMRKTTWANSWFQVKTHLETMSDPFISYDEYLQVCRDAGVTEKAGQDTLVDFLHDLGVVLHFRDFALEGTHVLEPKWVTEAVYKIINSEELANQRGILQLQRLGKLLAPVSDDDYVYPPDKHPYIVELMKKFELCYGINKRSVLVPDLLDVQEAVFPLEADQALRFIFAYDFLPKSIMPRFIVKMHGDIKDTLRWRTGVVLEDKNLQAVAVVKADEEAKKIYVAVVGAQKRDYFAAIRKTFRTIHQSFEKLDVLELIPLPDHETATVEYEELIGYERAGKSGYFVGKLMTEYGVKQLLDGIESERARQEREQDMQHDGKIVNIVKVEQTANPSMHVTSTTDSRAEARAQAEARVDFKVELPALQDEFSAFKRMMKTQAPALTEDLNQIENELAAVDPNAGERKEVQLAPFNKLRGLFNEINDSDSDLHNAVKASKKTLETAQKLGKSYNKVAQWLVLPTIPDLFLGE